MRGHEFALKCRKFFDKLTVKPKKQRKCGSCGKYALPQ